MSAEATKAATDDSVDYRKELERAYRALFAYAQAKVNNRTPSEAALSYHAMTIGAAVRFVLDSELDGSSYFEARDIQDLLETLRRLRS